MINEPSTDEIFAARNIAANIAWLGGPDLRHLSDKELVAKITDMSIRMADNFKKIGISIDDANTALTKFAKCFKARL